MTIINKFFDQFYFQGNMKKKNYFEGWYYKFVINNVSYIFIPGIALNKKNPHSFIQFFCSKNNSPKYYRFDVNDFKFNYKEKSFFIKNNYFSLNNISIDIPEIKTEISIFKHSFWENSLISPSPMGFFHYFPIMENYHAILTMNAFASGIINQKVFKNQKFYMEKDYGVSQPFSWIWTQCNNFEEESACLTFAFARVPFLKSSFKGIICGFMLGDKLYKFTTYNGAKITFIENKSDSILIKIKRKKYELIFKVTKNESSDLLSPQKGNMNKIIAESASSKVDIKLYKNNKLYYNDRGYNAGLEIVNIKDLL